MLMVLETPVVLCVSAQALNVLLQSVALPRSLFFVSSNILWHCE